MDASKINTLDINDLEIYDENIRIVDGTTLTLGSIKEVIKHILREKIWCKLTNNNVFYVHFGYDFNMYVGSNEPSSGVLMEITRNGLFVEECISPYINNIE